MKKPILILIGFLNISFAFGQTYSTVISDQEIYEFLNWMNVNNRKYNEEPRLKQKNISQKILGWEAENFAREDTAQIPKHHIFSADGPYLYQSYCGTDTLFKQDDRDFIFSQFTGIKDSIWDTQFSEAKLLKSKNQKRPNRYYYSIPLFSLDKKYVIIQMEYYSGSLCAHGGYYVYRRLDNNGWEYVTAIITWVS